MTGKAIVVDRDAEPAVDPERRPCRARLVLARVRSGYASTAEKPRAARSRHTSATSARAWPARRAAAVVAMQLMTAGSGLSGSCGYSSRSRDARG